MAVTLKQRFLQEFFRSDRKVAWTYLVLAWERSLAAFWPFILIIMTGLAVGLSDFLPFLPSVLHAAVLTLVSIAALGSLVWGIYRFPRPRRFDAERRLEIDNDLPHRPLTAAADHLALGTDDGFAAALWAAHRRRALGALALMRFPLPRPVLPLGDPRALRAATGLLLGLAIIASWGEMGPRLKRAISPSIFTGTPEITQLDVWINPPGYTSLPPIFLKSSSASQAADPGLTVPIGSKLTARFTGFGVAPALSFAGTDLPFDTSPGGQGPNHHIFTKEMTLEKSGRFSVIHGRKKLIALNLKVTPDNPPEVSFTAPPSTTPRSALKLDWQAKDDFGLSSAKIRIRLSPEENSAGGKTALDASTSLDLPLILPSNNPTAVISESFQDLTAHEWAGLKAQIQIIAVDALDQEGHSEIVTTTLPVRKFNNPVAQALADQRRDLARDETLTEEAADILDQLVVRPQLYYEDPVVFLGMRVGSVRLRHMDELEGDARKRELTEVRSLLWDLALRIEDGSMPLAMQDLRAAQDALQSALDRNAPDAEIEHLIEQLQQALQQYMKALMEEAARRLAEGAEPQPIDPAQTMDMRDIQSMMGTLRDMARSGAKDKAKQLLSQMRDLLERLQAAPSLAFDPRRQSDAESMMRDMQDLAERQQQLMDKTFQGMNGEPQSSQGQPGPGQSGPQGQPSGRQPGQGQPGQRQQGPGQFGNPTPGQLGQMQQYLRERLGDIVRRMGEGGVEIPGAFGKADRAMRDAAEALGRGNTGEAVDPQGQALDQLRQGMQTAMEAMRQQQNGSGQNPGQQPGGNAGDPRAGNPQDGRDPLGRPLSGQAGANNSDVAIPEEGELQRSREILDELRRRAGESQRAPLERDYIDRLLRQF